MSAPPIVKERLARFLDPATHLRSGAGKGANGEIDVCIMQAVDWLRGGDGRTDAPPCVSSSIREFCIRLNDSELFAKHRDLLKPYAVKVVGTATDDTTEIKRGFIAADYACRVFAPIWFGALGYPEWAKKCKALKPIKDKSTAEKGRDALRKIGYAAANAAYAAVNAAYAANAALTANAAYAANAAANAGYAATADGARNTAAKVRQKRGDELRSATLKCLDAMIKAAPKAKVLP